MRALAVELGPKGITANAIAPGFFLTDGNAPFFAQPRFVELGRRIPLRRFGRPEELVGAAIFLASMRVLHHGTSPDGGRGALGRPVAGPPRPTPDWDGTCLSGSPARHVIENRRPSRNDEDRWHTNRRRASRSVSARPIPADLSRSDSRRRGPIARGSTVVVASANGVLAWRRGTAGTTCSGRPRGDASWPERIADARHLPPLRCFGDVIRRADRRDQPRLVPARGARRRDARALPFSREHGLLHHPRAVIYCRPAASIPPGPSSTRGDGRHRGGDKSTRRLVGARRRATGMDVIVEPVLSPRPGGRIECLFADRRATSRAKGARKSCVTPRGPASR
jgi:hypothetical protein